MLRMILPERLAARHARRAAARVEESRSSVSAGKRPRSGAPIAAPRDACKIQASTQ